MRTLLEILRELPDYRKNKQIKLNVAEVMYIPLLVMLAGVNGYKDMVLLIKSKREELSKVLRHRLILPAYTTIRNVYLNIDLEALNTLYEIRLPHHFTFISLCPTTIMPIFYAINTATLSTTWSISHKTIILYLLSTNLRCTTKFINYLGTRLV